MTKKHLRFAAAAAAVLLLVSCSTRQDVVLKIGGSGTSRVVVELHPVFTRYYSDLASGFSPSHDPGKPVYFDTEGIRENLAANPGLEVVSLETPVPERLEIELRFRDIGTAIGGGDPKIRDVVVFRRGEGRDTLTIHLDRTNLSSILKVAAPDNASPLKTLLPPEGRPLTEEEYLDHLAWALEDYAENGDIGTILRSSAVNLRVQVQGRITALSGGTRRSESEAVFVLPLLRILTLGTPIDLSLTYAR